MPNTALVTAGSVLTATEFNYLPRGVVGRKSRTSNQTGVGAETDILADSGSLSVSWTATSSRVYRTTVYIPYLEQATTNAYVDVKITDGSNSEKGRSTHYQVVSQGTFVICTVTETGLSGSITRKGRATTSAGTITMVGQANYPIQIMVEDIGAA